VNTSIGTLTGELQQTAIAFTASSKVTGEAITPANFTINEVTKATGEVFPLNVSEHTVTFSKAGWFNKSFTFNTTALENQTLIVENVFNNQHNITLVAVNGTNITLGAYEITVLQEANAFSETLSGNGSISNSTVFNLTQGLVYNITVNAEGFKPVSVLTSNLSSLSTNQSIVITETGFTNAKFIIKDETKNALLSQNATIIIDRFNSSESYTVTNGNSSFLVSEFDSNIRFVASSSGYSTRTVVVDFTGERTDEYELTLGLLNTSGVTTETVRFVITNTASIAIQDAIVKIERATPDGLVLVEQKNTDISGVAQVVLDTEPQYFITITKDGFITNSFFLDITSNEYLIVLQPTFYIQYSAGFEGVYFTLFPNEGSTLPPNVTTFTLTSTAINDNLQLARISLFNGTDLVTPKITNTSSNSSGTSVTITYDLSEFLDQNFYIRVYHTVGGSTNFMTYQYHVKEPASTEGTIQDLRTWASENFSLNTRVMFLIFLMLLTMVLLAVFPIRANDNIMITLILSIFYSWSLGISLLIIAPIYTVIFIVVYASRGGN